MKENRGFLYGDGLFETIRIINKQPFNLRNHYLRLSKGLSLLRMESKDSPLSLEEFRLIVKQHIDKSASDNFRLRLTFYRGTGGYYTPSEHSFEYKAEIEALDSSVFELNNQGLKMGICDTVRLTTDALSTVKTISALPYVMAAVEKKEKGWDDAILLNINGNIAEAIAANLFLVMDGQILTPALREGCVAGTMRALIIEMMQREGILVKESTITLQILKKADHIFLTNAIKGIQWVEEIVGIKHYKKGTLGVDFIDKLNRF